MLAAAGLKPEQVPIEFGGTLADFDPAWFFKAQVDQGTTVELM